MKILLFCALLLISHQSMGQASGWVGYKPAHQIKFPFQNFIENSIYRMTTVGAVDHPSVQPKIINLTDPRYSKATTDAYKIENDFETLVIETCRKQNLVNCPVPAYAVTMTAFFNNDLLHSCRHGFHNWLLWAAQLNHKSIKEISPPIILYDRHGESIYNSGLVKKEQLLELNILDENPALEFTVAKGFTMNGKINFTNSDYVAMKPKSDLLTDSKLSTAKSRDDIQWDTEVFVFGYPAKTDIFKNGSSGNAPGNQLVASSGLIRSFPSDSTTFSSTHLAMEGASGSPVVTKDGKILGVSCYGDWYTTGDGISASSQVIFLNKTFLKKFWSRQ